MVLVYSGHPPEAKIRNAVDSQLAVRKHRLIHLLVLLELLILPEELEDLVHDFGDFVFYLIENEVVVASKGDDSGIFQIDEVSGCFGLREIENFFDIGNAHFTIHVNQVQNPDSRLIGAGFKNLGTKGEIKTF